MHVFIHSEMDQNLGPENQALASSQRGGSCGQAINGMMEKWNID